MSRSEIVVIGCSMGGLTALEEILGGLPRDLPGAVAVVQHRGAEEESQLIPVLQRGSPLPVGEAEDKELIRPGRVYVAPADYHLLVDEGRFGLSTDERVKHARPSIDMLFESAADAYQERVLAVVLTGASSDGARGVARVKARGGAVVVQDPATSESRLMPEAAVALADRTLQLAEIASFIYVSCRAGLPAPARAARGR